MIDSDDFNFSFSGLKTAVLYAVQDLEKHYKVTQLPNYTIAAVAAEFQQAVVDVLIAKTIRAARIYKAKSVMLGGGVAANKLLRRQLRLAVKKKLSVVSCLLPAAPLCTDNAAMIGLCAYYKYLENKNNLRSWREIKIDLNPKL
ncbi:MAG: O-sialoglycoprotein endopeptidase [Candidatus Berkelbacteria bacterium Licking1014_96]|uniref:O-sialoglycoprotein endopeptidase n=1 Tax=Candidatus Berkelbacteria bacterium Licking1014_96 TaxID=2017149 RepID=A0A554LH07_9BACT|nr:MAG: O-sialoglycoprotein endopeptidase [Candidatus Berkelbacteria bacterium Licking1014_96]